MSGLFRALVVAALVLATPAAARAASLTASTSAPPRVVFGDRFAISGEARFDPRRIDSSSVQVELVPTPFTPLGPPEVRRTGGEVHVTQVVACLEAGCVPARSSARDVLLPALRVRARRRDGSEVRVLARPAHVDVTTRLDARARRASTPRYVRQLPLPPPRFRIGAPLLETAFLGGAALLLILAAAAATSAARRPRSRSASRPTEAGLARALRLVRESVRRPPADRRRALDELASALEAQRARESAAATRLAWSAQEPTPPRVESLLRELGGGT